VDIEAIKQQVIDRALRECYDPEIPINIYELGLIYEIIIDDQAQVTIKMTLTSPACPVAEMLPREVELRVAAIEGVSGARVELVWDPPWGPERMSEAAKLQLDMIY
jgi:FeS assembly SUF system protein